MRSAKPLILIPVVLLGVVVIPANMQGFQMILDPKNLR